MIKYYCDKYGKEVDVCKEDYRMNISIHDSVNEMKTEFSLCAECKNKIVKYINSHTNNHKWDKLYTDGW